MLNLCHNSQDFRGIVMLNGLQPPVQSERSQDRFLVFRGTNAAPDLGNSDLGHNCLSFKNFFHRNAALLRYRIGIPEFEQCFHGSLHQVVGVR